MGAADDSVQLLYLSHVYAKVGVTNRTELATLAGQQRSGGGSIAT